MKPFVFVVLALAVATLGCAASKTAVAPPVQPGAVSGMDSMARVNGCLMTRDGDIVKLSSPLPDRALVQTRDAFRPPFTVTLRAATDSTNLRLYYNAGLVIFNWERGKDVLRVHDPLTNETNSLAGKGFIEPKQWHDITWEIKPGGMTLTVDGEMRFSTSGKYADITAPVGIGPAFGSVVSVESFEVTRP